MEKLIYIKSKNNVNYIIKKYNKHFFEIESTEKICAAGLGKSHCGIRNNEIVDKLAKTGINNLETSDFKYTSENLFLFSTNREKKIGKSIIKKAKRKFSIEIFNQVFQLHHSF